MRTVVNTDEVPHLWAHQAQASARNPHRSAWFEGPKLWSYSTVIGVIATNAKGEQAAVISNRRYSATTNQHQAGARSATRHIPQLFVHTIECGYYSSFSPDRQRGDFKHAIEDATKAIDKGRTRIARAKAFQALCVQIDTANKFCRFFGLPEFPQPIDDAGHVATLADWNAKAPERSARAQAASEARYRTSQLRWSDPAEYRRIMHEKNAKAIEAWRRGSAVRLPDLGFELMRVRGSHVETSLGAVVPADQVAEFAPMILRLASRGREWTPDPTDPPLMLGHYRLNRITEDGTVCVGCHRFTRDECERLAESLPSVAAPI